ncbi:MAG TPA: undecaprenyldiphospho-muramoylpentapeptide beta-N-acetylglucosaminyltransferase [Thermoanaerobaculia bacterium]|nr:undecaprenyldiphospho-muramoylpentapeptide beta-N-acetylglucosaminyltransferase [Thermoanaerobaculia bacterium]
MIAPSPSTTLMIAGGGTGGHIYPAIAIAQEYKGRDPKRQVVFVGTEYGLEKTLVPKAGFPLEFVSVRGLKGKGIGETLLNILRLPKGFIDAWLLLTKYLPAAVIGVGGYASGPVLLVAALRGFPTLIDEQNAFPGLTNRLLAKVVKQVAVGFPEALPRLGREGVVTGNPVRREFFDFKRAGGEGGSERQRLLVFGGSQGSKILNDAMTGALLFLAHLKDRLEIVHQTGPANLAEVQKAYIASAFSGSRVVPYLDPIVTEIGNADLVVSRSGAMTIGELAALGKAAVLVPFARATNNHQELNARAVEAVGGAVVITESELTPERLAGAISTILSESGRSIRMGEGARRLAAPDAGRKIVDLIELIQRN